jgi:membrane-bound lytic murein transglycosylase D
MAAPLQWPGRRAMLALAAFLIVGCGTLEHDRGPLREPQRPAAGWPDERRGAAPVGETVPVPDTAAQSPGPQDAVSGPVPATLVGIDDLLRHLEPEPERATPPRLTAAPALTLDAARTMPAASPGASLWTRIRAGFAMPELQSPLVAQRVRWYTARPEDLKRMLERGAPYLHFIVEEIAQRGLPMELALLPFVESAMNPIALSHASAAGLWQFIPATGRRFDLSQDWWIDERRDVVSSTRAALEYLQEVHAMHGDDWFLALASYNWGENAVARAVKANRRAGKPTGYEHLRMPNETRHYVPKLLALREIVARADALGIDLPTLPDRPYFVSIEHASPMDIKLAARFAGMSLEDFVALNPAHNRPVIAANRHDEIRLPIDRVEAFQAAALRHAQMQRPFVSWQPHTLAAGESIEAIAERTGVGAGEIRTANGLPAGRPLRAGSRILVPAPGVSDASYVAAFHAPYLLFHAPPRAARKGYRGARGAPAAVTRTASGARVRTTSAAQHGQVAPKPAARVTRGADKAAPAARPTTASRGKARARGGSSR